MTLVAETAKYDNELGKYADVEGFEELYNELAKGYEKTDFVVEGKNIYYKPYSTYLIFYVVEDMEVIIARVLKDGMHWQAVMNRTKKIIK